MGKAFTKGQRVTVISDWDRKGTVCVRHATVHSCGTKVLRLTCDVTGDEFGDEYAPVVAEQGRCGVRPYLDGESLAVEAMAVATNQLEAERKYLTECRDHNAAGPNPCRHYVAGMNASLAALHYPCWDMYEVLLEEIMASIRVG